MLNMSLYEKTQFNISLFRIIITLLLQITFEIAICNFVILLLFLSFY